MIISFPDPEMVPLPIAANLCRCSPQLIRALVGTPSGPLFSRRADQLFFRPQDLDAWCVDAGGPRSKHPLDHLRPGFLSASPVEALGVFGDLYFYRDSLGERRSLPASQHSRLAIASLFAARLELLTAYWPLRFGDLTAGWDDCRAAETLMGSAARIGIIDPESLGFPVSRPKPNRQRG